MIRNLKVLGLALVALVAVGAISASAALAAPEFTSTSYPVEIHAKGVGLHEEFTTEAGAVVCEESTFDGTATAASPTLEVHPVYNKCTAFGFVGATVNTETCNYLFHATEKVSTDNYKLHTDVVCPTGKSIKISASTCKAEVKAQTGLTTVKASDMTMAETTAQTPPEEEDVTVEPEVNNQIAYTVTEDGFLCPFNGTGNKTGGSYNANLPVTVQGFKDPGKTETSEVVGIEISG